MSASESSKTCTTTVNKYNGEKGVLASTTANITGAYEYTMGNMSSVSGNYTFYPSSSEFTSGW